MLPRSMRESIRHRVGPFAPWERGFPAAAPAPAAGAITGPPDFVGIGVQKAGTTWWYELLCSHPGVDRGPQLHKERHFFARFAVDAFGAPQIAQYHAWFPRRPGAVTGEWTPDYLFQPWVAPLLAAAAPEARLLVMVRDPVERLVSGVAHAGLTHGSHLGSVMAEAVLRGFYASALRPWTERFPAGQVLVLQYERCVADPRGELDRTFRHVGLEGPGGAVDVRREVSPTRGERIELPPDARRRLVELYAPDVAELARMFPDLDVGLWPNFSGR